MKIGITGGVKSLLNADLKKLEKAAKGFYNLSRMMIVFFDDKRNVLFSYPERMCTFCKEVRKSRQLAKQCLHCDEIGFNMCDRTKKTYVYHCHMGLTEAISPICENGFIIGYMMLGQVLDTKDIDPLSAHAVKMGKLHYIDSDILVKELRQMQITDKETILSAADMMEMCACYLWLNQIISVKSESLIQHINNYICDHISEDLTVKSICRHVHISKSTLYKLSTAYFKMGISDYIRLNRMQKAEQLFKKGALSIYEIAEQVGIPDASYFTKLFKKHTGKTPSEYKKSLE